MNTVEAMNLTFGVVIAFLAGMGVGYQLCRRTLLQISQAIIGEPGTAHLFGYPPPEGSEETK